MLRKAELEEAVMMEDELEAADIDDDDGGRVMGEV